MRLFLIAAAFAATVAGCGGGGDSSAAAPSPAPVVVVAPSGDPAPVLPCVAADTSAAFAAERVKLPHWFSGGIVGKRILLVGDSTSSQMGPVAGGGLDGVFDDFLAAYVAPAGVPLHGATVGVLASSGVTLTDYAAHDSDFTSGTGLFATTQSAADVIVFSYGINDARTGASGDAIVANLRKVVNTIRAAKPNVDIVLRVPNSFLTTDTGEHFVQPNSQAQAYSTVLRDAYLSLAAEWPNVAVYDAQALLFGETSTPAHSCMADQIHPSVQAYGLIYQQLVQLLAP